jgi:4-amino-4-deoxy-L-arabinose transferase-like glycosyltransferase
VKQELIFARISDLLVWFTSRRLNWPLIAGVSFLFSLSAIAIQGIPLGHDESVYALRGHDLQNGYTYLSGDYWRDYRAPGMSFLDSWLFNLFGENDLVARLPSMFLGLFLFFSTYLLAKELFGIRIAKITSLLFIATPPLVVNSAYLLADVPGASISIFCVFLVFYLQRIKAHPLLLLTSIFVLGTMATLLRFGSFISYGSGIFAASLYFIYLNFNRSNISRLILRQVSVQFVSLFSFGWLYFTDFTSINGKTPYEANSDLAAGAGVTPLNGLKDLIELTNPFSIWSQWLNPLFGVILMISLFFAAYSIAAKSVIKAQTAALLVAGILSLSLIVVGVRYVQGNYLALSAPYWVIISAVGFDVMYKRYIKRYALDVSRIRIVNLSRTLILLLVLFYLPFYYYSSSSQNETSTKYGVRAAGKAIGFESNGEKCLVLSSYPQSAWYSKCLLGLWAGTTEENITQGAKSSSFNNIVRRTLLSSESARWQAMRDYQDLDEYRKFVVLVTKGKRQPSDLSIESDRYTLLEKIRTTHRVFYAEIDGLTIKGP